MSFPLGSHAAGFLLSTGFGAIERRDIARLENLRPVGEVVPGWNKYEYLTQYPVPEVDLLPGEPPFRHTLLLRWGRTSLLALAHRYRVVQHFIRHDLRPRLRGAVRLNEIQVHDLILHMSQDDQQRQEIPAKESSIGRSSEGDPFKVFYTLSFAAGRTDAFGEDLRKMQFFGDRISKAQLFQSCLPLMRFYSCALRHEGTDVIKLGRDGYVAFDIPSNLLATKARFAEVNRVLRSLTDRRFII